MLLFLSYLFLSSLFLSCGRQERCSAIYDFPDQTSYEVNANLLSPKSIAIDTSGLNISTKLVDRLTDEVETCLIKNFGNPPILPPDVQRDGSCPGETFQLPIRRQCLTVKVANDWFLSENEADGSKQQLLPFVAGYGGCGKGLSGDDPCYWRAGIQDNLTIVTTPSFYLYKDPLVKITTGCTNAWFDAKLAACMLPTTKPLSDGSEE